MYVCVYVCMYVCIMFTYNGVAGGSSQDKALLPQPPKKKGGRDPITNKGPWTKEVSSVPDVYLMCTQYVPKVYLMCT